MDAQVVVNQASASRPPSSGGAASRGLPRDAHRCSHVRVAEVATLWLACSVVFPRCSHRSPMYVVRHGGKC